MWIGTYGGGLYRLKNRTFTHISSKVGLFDDAVFQILEDNDHNFWISCNKSIYRVGKQQLNAFADGKIASITCTSYGISDGMITSECNGNAQPAGCKTLDGTLIFPTTKGVVVINPSDLRTNAIPPPVVIEDAMIDGKSCQVDLRSCMRRLVARRFHRNSCCLLCCCRFCTPPVVNAC